MDAEDVLQSAFRSFFGGLENGKFAVEGEGDLWGLLAAITLHKLYRQVRSGNAVRECCAGYSQLLQSERVAAGENCLPNVRWKAGPSLCDAIYSRRQHARPRAI
jgi:hypothetical protein